MQLETIYINHDLSQSDDDTGQASSTILNGVK